MIDIHVGEYIRTKNGCIEKVTQIDELYIDEEGEIEIVIGCDIEGASVYDMITKHSFNIIDLIEVGDYVKIGNKEYLDDFYSCVCNVGIAKRKRKFIELDCGGDGTEFIFDTNLIKLIITHEQMTSMEYKVGDDEV